MEVKKYSIRSQAFKDSIEDLYTNTAWDESSKFIARCDSIRLYFDASSEDILAMAIKLGYVQDDLFV
jgi:hypothetical protein